MQRVFACVDADRTGQSSFRLPRHGDVLLVLLSPQRQLLGAGARPVHPILGPGPNAQPGPKEDPKRTFINVSTEDLSQRFRICATRLNSSRSVVMRRGGANVLMREQLLR